MWSACSWGLPPAAPGTPPLEALLPRGLLREPLSSLGRADAVVLTRCDQSSEEIQDAVEDASAAMNEAGESMTETTDTPD